MVVEDDPNIADLVDLYLRQAGFRVLQRIDGPSGLDAVTTHEPDLVILDVGLPGQMDGLELCRRLRAERAVPIIMLTARDGEIDRVLGLELGADDYVTKPFSPRELAARIAPIGGRPRAAPDPETWDFGSLRIDVAARETILDGQVLDLTRLEFDLLAKLASEPRRAFSRDQLLNAVWGGDWYGDDHVVDVHIGNLRKKLGESGTQPRFVHTVRGVGFRFESRS